MTMIVCCLLLSTTGQRLSVHDLNLFNFFLSHVSDVCLSVPSASFCDRNQWDSSDPSCVAETWPSSLQVNQLLLDLMPLRKDGSRVDWAHDIRRFWTFGEDGANRALKEFVFEGAYHFEGRERFRADRKYTAVISPFVRFGELSPRTVHWAIVQKHGTHRAKTFLRCVSLLRALQSDCVSFCIVLCSD